MSMPKNYLLVFYVFFLVLFSCSNENEEKPLSSENYITSFIVKKGNLTFEPTIGVNSVSGLTPSEFTLEDIRLEVNISEGATISPNPSTITSLKESFKFTITSEDGSIREYLVDIGRALSSDNFITSFKLKKEDFSFEPDISSESIVGIVPSHILLEDISLEVEISESASIDPDPSTIVSISDTFAFSVTAENGDVREYQVDISRELSSENAIISFVAVSSLNSILVDEVEDGVLFKRLPPFIDLGNMEVEVQISDFASITPNPSEVSDFTVPIVFTVTAENGNEKTYEVGFETMTNDFEVRCDDSNASKWFGGDDRVNPDFPFGPYDRNVGTGQSIKFSHERNPEVFGVLFSHGFSYSQAGGYYDQDLEVKLNIRDETGIILTNTSVIIPPSFRGGWVYFDLKDLEVLLKADTTYLFTWQLVNGGELGVNTGSYGDNMNSGPEACSGIGFSGESRVAFETNLDTWNLWFEHPWHFNISMSGKE